MSKSNPISMRSSDIIQTWAVTAPAIESQIQQTRARDQFEEANALSTSLPNGFQLLNTLGSTRSMLRAMLYISIGKKETYATLDSTHIHITGGGTQARKIPVTRQNGKASFSEIAGLDGWIYIEKWKIIVASIAKLELKVITFINERY